MSSSPLRIDFYTRAGCHLCDDAKELVERLKQHHQLEVIYHDVDTQPALAEEYGNQVPVLVISGKKRFWGRIEPALLERCLREEGKRT